MEKRQNKKNTKTDSSRNNSKGSERPIQDGSCSSCQTRRVR